MGKCLSLISYSRKRKGPTHWCRMGVIPVTGDTGGNRRIVLETSL